VLQWVDSRTLCDTQGNDELAKPSGYIISSAGREVGDEKGHEGWHGGVVLLYLLYLTPASTKYNRDGTLWLHATVRGQYLQAMRRVLQRDWRNRVCFVLGK